MRGLLNTARQQSSVYKYTLPLLRWCLVLYPNNIQLVFPNSPETPSTTTNMAPRHKRKLSDTIATTLATIQLKPLQGAQIEAVTRTHNELRAAGVNSEVELPATIVAGDTSSGKSSVMCRLTGLPFPRGEGVVTKFATEVDMMPGPKETIQVSIRPDKSRPEDEQAALLRYIRDIELDGFEATFTDVCMFMGRPGDRKLFADVLHISFTGPSCPPLTVIDLPGLIHAATQKVSDADRKLSEKLAKQYIRDKRTIVLAVVSASNDSHSPARCRRQAADGKRRPLCSRHNHPRSWPAAQIVDEDLQLLP